MQKVWLLWSRTQDDTDPSEERLIAAFSTDLKAHTAWQKLTAVAEQLTPEIEYAISNIYVEE